VIEQDYVGAFILTLCMGALKGRPYKTWACTEMLRQGGADAAAGAGDQDDFVR
jgi:hypothetical protein